METAFPSRSRNRHPSRRQTLEWIAGGVCLLACLQAAMPAYAQEDMFVSRCGVPTPSTRTSHYPGVNNIVLSNDLGRPAGKVHYAPGQILVISGRVTDENCVPVANAIIDLWQANPYGEYRWATRDELLNPEPVFAGSGRAVTDNLGRYHFTTLFPGSTGRTAPHVQFRITHPDFQSLDTSMYFSGDRRNMDDPKFKAFKADTQGSLQGRVNNLAEGKLGALFDITLKGRNPFRSF